MSWKIVAVILGVAVLKAESAQSKLPNIIYILADDLGYGELGCYGQEKIKTPNIDRVAQEGIRFTQHYSGQAVCAPSRCSFLTGLHQGHAYIRNNRELPEGQLPLPADIFSIPWMLKGEGYVTACVGKWGLGATGTAGDPDKQGFDLFFGFKCQRRAHQYYRNYLWKNDQKVFYPENRDIDGPNYAADEMCREALQFVNQNRNNPFFLYWAIPIPHVSLQVPESSLMQYKGIWEEHPYKGGYSPETGMGYTGHLAPRAAYAAMISHMDLHVGQLMSLLDELNIADNTLLIFTSDNGPTFTGGVDAKFFNSTGGLRGLKGELYEGGIRVPFVARWPGKIRPGAVSAHVSAFWDMLPTFADVAGIKVPENIDGISMLPALTGSGMQVQHPFLYWEFNARNFNGGQIAVRMGDWKGIKTHQLALGGRGGAPKEKKVPGSLQLYNLSSDPQEKTDLAGNYPQMVKKMEAVIKREHVPSEIFSYPELD